MGLYINGVRYIADSGTFVDDVSVGDDLAVGDAISAASLTLSGDIALTAGGSITSTSNGNISLTPDGTGIVICGTGATSRLTASSGDLFVSGELEVDGIAHFDSAVRMYANSTLYDNVLLYVGHGGTQGYIRNYSAGYEQHFAQTDGAWVFNPTYNVSHNHRITGGTQTLGVPAIYVHSATSPATDATEYAGLGWNQLRIGGDTGSFCDLKSVTEAVTIGVGAGAGGVATSGNLAPANSLIVGAAVRVTDAPGGGATTFDLGITGGNVDGLIDACSTALNSTKTSAGGNDGTQLPLANASATTLTITTDGNVTGDAMIVRVVVYYIQLTAPTA